MGDEAYEQRLASATALLDDPTRMVAIERAVASVASHPEAYGTLLRGAQAMQRAKRVGLLPSSFNPLTRAHVALAQAAMSAGRLDALVWLIAVVTVDKERVERASLPDRLAQMTAYADTAGDAVAVVNRGLYVDQARATRTIAPEDARFSFVVGFDKIEQIFDPRYYSNRDAALADLFAHADVLVAPRAGYDESALHALMARPENRRFATSVHYSPLDEAFRKDSSTEARALMEAGRVDSAHETLAPEGFALASLGPYLAPSPASPDTLGDAYSARTAWLAALRDVPEPEAETLPPLHVLVAASADPGARGVRLREWVRTGGRGGILALKDALGTA